jgi:hypothetical protein
VNAPPGRRAALISAAVGILGLLLLVGFGRGDPTSFFRAYLLGYTFWLGLGIGSLGVALIQFLTGGGWGLATRRIFEAGAATVPLLAVLFLPIFFGIPVLYPWAQPDVVSTSAVIQHKILYLNPPFFVVRSVVYLVCWIVLVLMLRRLSRLDDRTADPQVLRRLQRFSIVGVLLLGLTVSFAAIDWLMSLEPEWYSTMYPPLVAMSGLLLALAFAIVVVTWLTPAPVLADIMSPQLLNDLGSLLLAFLMLLAYLSYFQYMLIWAGNLSDEIPWYLARVDGGWRPLALVLVFVGFMLPFFLLLFRPLKRRRGRLAAIAGLVCVTQVAHVYWLVAPPFEPAGPAPSWLDPLALVGFGGLSLAVFAWQLAARPLIPAFDPRLAELREAAHATA